MEQSFSVDTGGGGRESNIHLIPYIIHTVLYVLNTSVSFSSNLFLLLLVLEKTIKGSSLCFVCVCGKKRWEITGVSEGSTLHILNRL